MVDSLQDSASVVLITKTIKDVDTTLPQDITENAVELRAVAAIAVGELLINDAKNLSDYTAILAALAIRSALSLRHAPTDKHLRFILDTLLAASDELLRAAGDHLRQRTARPWKN